MRVTFVAPSGAKPVGGVIALYEFANGLARLGHEVHMVHAPMWGRQVGSPDDLERYRFVPAVTHHLPGGDAALLPDSDVVFGTGAPERLGLPVLLVQGVDMLFPHIEREAFRTPCLKICIASWLVDAVALFGVPPEQARVVPMGIDHDRFRVVTQMDRRPPQVAVLYSSHPAKGWEVAFGALRRARERVPHLRAVAFGADRPPGILPDWVAFHGDPPPHRLVEEIYNTSSVFLQASDYEGFGFTAVEAMACGCALVTTDNGGSRDYADPNVSAMVAEPGDVEALSAHVVALLEDAHVRARVADAGRRAALGFDWAVSAQLLEVELERYLEDPEPFLRPPGPPDPAIDHALQGELASQVLRATRTMG